LRGERTRLAGEITKAENAANAKPTQAERDEANAGIEPKRAMHKTIDQKIKEIEVLELTRIPFIVNARVGAHELKLLDARFQSR
jgi:hypothetical protein